MYVFSDKNIGTTLLATNRRIFGGIRVVGRMKPRLRYLTWTYQDTILYSAASMCIFSATRTKERLCFHLQSSFDIVCGVSAFWVRVKPARNLTYQETIHTATTNHDSFVTRTKPFNCLVITMAKANTAQQIYPRLSFGTSVDGMYVNHSKRYSPLKCSFTKWLNDF